MYRQATYDDVPGIIELQDTQSIDDAQRVLFFPEPYKSNFLRNAISKGRMYVAVDDTNNIVVAQLKLFIVDALEEQQDILCNELCCTSDGRQLLEGYYAYGNGVFEPCERQYINNPRNTLFLYLGSEFTRQAYRGQSINTRLEKYAFGSIIAAACDNVQTNGFSNLALLFGLVDENTSRAVSIFRQFLPFAQFVSREFEIASAHSIAFFAYRAYKPTFELSPAGELVKLPGGQPGRGCIFLYQLR